MLFCNKKIAPANSSKAFPPSKRMDFQMKVLCVLNHEDEYPTDTLLHIKDHCDLLNIPFYTRAYDSIKFSEDRKYIQKLPAFHIFVKGLHKDTFYTDSSPKVDGGAAQPTISPKVDGGAAQPTISPKLKIRYAYDKYKAKATAAAKEKSWSILWLFTLFSSKKPLKLVEWK